MPKYSFIILTIILLTGCNFHRETDLALYNSQSDQWSGLHKTADAIDSESIEKAPQFPGGEDNLNLFITENLHYPSKAIQAGITGKVYVSFTIRDTGLLQDIKIIKGIGYGCEEEVIRLVRQMPAWEPGLQSGQPIDVNYILPVEFKATKMTKK